MQLLERYLFLVYFRKTLRRKRIVQSKFYLRPNFISRSRYAMGLVSVLLFHYVSPQFSILFWGFWMITDITDGTIARRYNVKSPNGESIDPFSDKLFYIPPLFYVTYLGHGDFYLVSIFTIIDLFGQFSRKFVENKRANLFGKAKTFLVVTILVVVFMQHIYFGRILFPYFDNLMIVAIILSICSMTFRAIPNYWYGNILTLINLLCGLLGIVLIVMGYNIEYAFLLVFLGQFLDFFDGRLIEKWGGTDRGELYDDIADGTNFGATIGFIAAYTILPFALALVAGLIYFGCTVYRLWRFIKNKRAKNIKTGVSLFEGLPSPAGASLVGSALVLLYNYREFLPINDLFLLGLQILIVVLACILMTSKIPYLHFGRALLPKIPIYFRVLILITIILLLIIGVDAGKYPWIILFTFGGTVFYLFYGCQSLHDRQTNKK